MRSEENPNQPWTGRDTKVFFCIWLLALGWLLAWNPFERALLLDAATWDSLSVGLAHGEVPYRDVFLHKTPGAAFLGALGVLAAERIGATPVAGAHAAFLIIGALCPALLYAVCRSAMSFQVALLASLWLLASDLWLVASLEGVRPKIATMALGLGALLAASRDKATVAGACAVASSLCWQPGLVFGLGALGQLVFDHPRNWRRSLAGFSGGCALVLASFAAWLLLTGSLWAFLDDAIVFNLHYVEQGLKTPASTLGRLSAIFRKYALDELLLGLVALPGLLLLRPALPLGLVVSGLLYLAAVFTSFQGWPDTLLLLPGLAALLAAGTMATLTVCLPQGWAPCMAMLLAVWAAALPASERTHTPWSFTKQAEKVEQLLRGVSSEEAVIAIGAPEVLLHSGRGRDWPWPYFWFGVDEFAANRSGGFDRMIYEIEELDPALILIARRWQGRYRKAFNRWAPSRYTRSTVTLFPHTSPPIEVWSRKP